jgi:replicative DNA helicase
MDVGRSVKKQDEKVLYFSLEVPEDELTQREAAAEIGLEPRHFTHDTKRVKVFNTLAALYGTGTPDDILIDDSRREFRQICAYALTMRRRENVGFVIVDHLGLVKHPNPKLHFVQQVSEIVIGFKELAMRMGVPILLLSQLNRECEKRPDKRPILSDLRSTGEIEQSADVVLAIYRDVMYRPWHESDLAEINVLKNRSGQTGRAYLWFRPEWTTFEPVNRDDLQKELERIEKMTSKGDPSSAVDEVMASRSRGTP